MQLTPAIRQKYNVRDTDDPLQSAIGGGLYLRDLYKQYGNWLLAIAAYNGGGGAVDYYRKHGTFQGYGVDSENPKGQTYQYLQKVVQVLSA